MMSTPTSIVLFGDTFVHSGPPSQRIDSVRFRSPVTITSATVLGTLPVGAAVIFYVRVKDSPRFVPLLSGGPPSPPTDFLAIRGTYSRASVVVRGSVASTAALTAAAAADSALPPSCSRIPATSRRIVNLFGETSVPWYRSTPIADVSLAETDRRLSVRLPVPNGNDLGTADMVDRLAVATEEVERSIKARFLDLDGLGRCASELLSVGHPCGYRGIAAAASSVKSLCSVSASFGRSFAGSGGVSRIVELLSFGSASSVMRVLLIDALDACLCSPECSSLVLANETARDALKLASSGSHTKVRESACRILRNISEASAVTSMCKSLSPSSPPSAIVESLDWSSVDTVLATAASFGSLPRAVVGAMESGNFIESFASVLERDSSIVVSAGNRLVVLLLWLLRSQRGVSYLLSRASFVNRIVNVLDPKKDVPAELAVPSLEMVLAAEGIRFVASPVLVARLISLHLHACAVALALCLAPVEQRQKQAAQLISLAEVPIAGEEAASLAIAISGAVKAMAECLQLPNPAAKECTVLLRGLFFYANRPGGARAEPAEIARCLQHVPVDESLSPWIRLPTLWNAAAGSPLCIQELVRSITLEVTSENEPQIISSVQLLCSALRSRTPCVTAALPIGDVVVSVGVITGDIAARLSITDADSLASLLDTTRCLVPLARACLELVREILLHLSPAGALKSSKLLASILDVYSASCNVPVCPCMVGPGVVSRASWDVSCLQRDVVGVLIEWMRLSSDIRSSVLTTVFERIPMGPKHVVPMLRLLDSLLGTDSKKFVWDDAIKAVVGKLHVAVSAIATTGCQPVFAGLCGLVSRISVECTPAAAVLAAELSSTLERTDTVGFDSLRPLVLLSVLSRSCPASVAEAVRASQILGVLAASDSHFVVACSIIGHVLSYGCFARGEGFCSIVRVILSDVATFASQSGSSRQRCEASLFVLCAALREAAHTVCEEIKGMPESPLNKLLSWLAEPSNTENEKVAALAVRLVERLHDVDPSIRLPEKTVRFDQKLLAQLECGREVLDLSDAEKVLEFLGEAAFRNPAIDPVSGLFNPPPIRARLPHTAQKRLFCTGFRTTPIVAKKPKTEGAPQSEAKLDTFRSRAPNTSRPASLHVDQFESGSSYT